MRIPVLLECSELVLASADTQSVTDHGMCVCCAGTLSLLPLAPQLGSSEHHHHQNIGSQPKSLLITVFSAGTEFTFLTVA